MGKGTKQMILAHDLKNALMYLALVKHSIKENDVGEIDLSAIKGAEEKILKAIEVFERDDHSEAA
ncbi:MAG: hypothetical protein Unbinned5081contig1003_24 [Prokaryotic dsDNA virus sp.]|nr:MAG: hypothetical protein Unbinned5081contig1003_24 [Prokaryotic dsDNA virus sp.]|tara:strand:- start:3688 stop:3882 length:195 start_codon:yes stop_codon:yes gene_type:complete